MLKNLGSIIAGVWNWIFNDNASWKHVDGSTSEAADVSGFFSNLAAKYAGTGLTDAEKEANAWTAQREDTAFQRQVSDMRSAGLNPALLYGSSAGSGAPSSASVSPGSTNLNLSSVLGSMLQYRLGSKQLDIQEKLADAEVSNKAASTAKMEAETESTSEQTKYFKSVAAIRAEAESLENEMKGSQIRAIDISIRHEKAKIAQTIENTKEIQERQKLIIEQAILANTQAGNIKYMQPFLAKESASRAGLNAAQARMAAVDEAYRQGLIDEGAIKAAVRLDNAKASESEIDTKSKQFAQALKDGSLRQAANEKGDWRSYVSIALYEALNNASASIFGKW